MPKCSLCNKVYADDDVSLKQQMASHRFSSTPRCPQCSSSSRVSSDRLHPDQQTPPANAHSGPTFGSSPSTPRSSSSPATPSPHNDVTERHHDTTTLTTTLPRDSLPSVYKNLASLVKKYQSHLSDRSAERFKTLTQSLRRLDTVSMLVKSKEYLDSLQDWCTELELGRTESYQRSLVDDKVEIEAVLRRVLSSEADERAVLSLSREEAGCFTDVLDIHLASWTGTGDTVTNMARRLSRKLHLKFDSINPTHYIQGIIVNEMDPIAFGGFSEVFRGWFRGRMVAVKRIRIFANSDVQMLRRKLCKEVFVLQSLRDHPYLLPFLGVDFETWPKYPGSIVSPFMENGTVMRYCASRRATMSMGTLKILLSEIVQGLDYLHSQHVVHGDLCGRNILIDDSGHPRLADFGLSWFSDVSRRTTTMGNGSIAWMAPELLSPPDDDNFVRTPRSDVYALGCTFLEIYTGKHPFSDTTPNLNAITLKVMRAERPPRPLSGQGELWGEIPDWLWILIEDCWKQDTADRPTTSVILRRMKSESPSASESPQNSVCGSDSVDEEEEEDEYRPRTRYIKPPARSSQKAAAVDSDTVPALLDKRVAAKHQRLLWRESVVDLMKTLDMDSSIGAREKLAIQLRYYSQAGDTTTNNTSSGAQMNMNMWLHKQILARLEKTGGRVPDEFRI